MYPRIPLLIVQRGGWEEGLNSSRRHFKGNIKLCITNTMMGTQENQTKIYNKVSTINSDLYGRNMLCNPYTHCWTRGVVTKAIYSIIPISITEEEEYYHINYAKHELKRKSRSPLCLCRETQINFWLEFQQYSAMKGTIFY